MRRVARDKTGEIGDVGIGDRHRRRQVELGQRLARAPDTLDAPVGVGERREHGVAAPATDPRAALPLPFRASMTAKQAHARAFPPAGLEKTTPYRQGTATPSGAHAKDAER